ncbi:BrnA antitoxin family protein [Candidatus Magnetominusculus xianensis]|nr:BrnA antitoxin family protein [Candidatus Magnetominusculus xianensis]MBF0405543.1 BrnA antitoxin family protein [Nitrospirota bacterium]
MNDMTDWARVAAMTDSNIEEAVASDPDTFIPDAKWFEKAQIVMPKVKETVTLRLDPDVLKWFRHDGRGYQTRINAVLRAFVEAQEHRVRS